MAQDVKLYLLNVLTFLLSLTDWIEPILKVTLLILTIGYTVHKWWKLYKEKDPANLNE